MPDIFLTYSRDDRVFMQTLLNNLRKLGFNVWIDEEHLTVGTPEWQNAIEEAVAEVDAMVVIMTPSAKASKWVNIEVVLSATKLFLLSVPALSGVKPCKYPPVSFCLHLAYMYETPIIPVLAAGDERTAVPVGLLTTQYADMRGRSDYDGGFRQLISGLAAHIGLTVDEFSLDFSGEPRVQINVYGQNDGTIVAVGRDVAGDIYVAEGDVIGRDKAVEPAKSERGIPPDIETHPASSQQPPKARSKIGGDVAGHGQPPSDIVQRLEAALNTGNIDDILDLYHPNAVHITADHIVKGLEELRRYYDTFLNNLLPDAQYALTMLAADGAILHVSWNASASIGSIVAGQDAIGVRQGKIQYHSSLYVIS